MEIIEKLLKRLKRKNNQKVVWMNNISYGLFKATEYDCTNCGEHNKKRGLNLLFPPAEGTRVEYRCKSCEAINLMDIPCFHD